MKRGHAIYYSVDLRIQTYTEPVSLKCEQLNTKYPWIYGYLLQCRPDNKAPLTQTVPRDALHHSHPVVN